MMSDERIYTVKEAAEILGVNMRKVQRAIREGKIRAFRETLNGHWHIEHNDLMKVKKAERIYNIDSMPDNVQC